MEYSVRWFPDRSIRLVCRNVRCGGTGRSWYGLQCPTVRPAEWEQEFKVGGCFGVEGKFFRLMVTQTQVFVGHAQIKQPFVAEVFPVFEPFQVGVWFAEEFQLHLFKFSGTEGKVTWSNFVTEGFTYLADTEWQFFTGSTLNVCKVYKDTLCSFRTQVDLALSIFGYTLEGFEHQVELTDISEVCAAAVWTLDAVFFDEVHHLFVAPTVCGFAGEVFDQFVCTMTGLAVFAVHQWVREAANMAGSNPNFWIHQNCAVQTNVVWILLYKAFPPSAFYVVFELYTQRTVIPCIRKTAVDFRTGKNKTSAFAQRNDFFHCFFSVVHLVFLLADKVKTSSQKNLKNCFFKGFLAGKQHLLYIV